MPVLIVRDPLSCWQSGTTDRNAFGWQRHAMEIFDELALDGKLLLLGGDRLI
jgi:hypothetical protein